jgi:hypothetical protein
MDIQARITAALCAIHNFISIYDPTEDVVYADDEDEDAPVGNDVAAAAAAIEDDGPSVRRDRIAQAMWDDYCVIRQERGASDDSEDEPEDVNSELEEDIQ